MYKRQEEDLGEILKFNLENEGYFVDTANSAEEALKMELTQYEICIRDSCMRGDVFQIILSRRFIQRYEGDDFKLYRALRSINPSPYLFYFDFGGFRIFGSSPETHCKIENGRATIDPIAGTTRRNGDKNIDAELPANLLADPKRCV